MRRVALIGPGDRLRTTILVGDALSPEPDDVLEHLVATAARDLAVDCVTISLVLAETAWFRAHTGLPAELASLRCLHASSTPAQYVVRDEAPFEIHDLLNVPDAPQELAERWGFRGYAGAPLRVDGVVVGSLDLYTREARSWTHDDLHRVRALAHAASARLSRLVLRATPRVLLLGEVLTPALAELRTILAVHNAIDSVDREMRRINETLAAIQALLGSTGPRVRVADVIRHADCLARHRTVLVGGVLWDVEAREDELDVSGMISTAVLAAGLSAVAQRTHTRHGMTAEVRRIGACVEFEISGELPSDAADDCAASVGDLTGDSMIDVRASNGSVVIAMVAA